MPARNGSGPVGQGSRTGRGKGNCTSTNDSPSQPQNSGITKPSGLGGRVWDNTFGRLFGRRRGQHKNRK